MNKAINNRMNYAVNTYENSSLASLKAIIEKVVNAFSVWEDRIQQRRELSALSDHMLKDIGISRIEAQAEVRKPFWQK